MNRRSHKYTVVQGEKVDGFGTAQSFLRLHILTPGQDLPRIQSPNRELEESEDSVDMRSCFDLLAIVEAWRSNSSEVLRAEDQFGNVENSAVVAWTLLHGRIPPRRGSFQVSIFSYFCGKDFDEGPSISGGLRGFF